jgi:hypothetical protein
MRLKPSISARSESLSGRSLLSVMSSRIRRSSSGAKAKEAIAAAFSGDEISRSMIADSEIATVDMRLFYRPREAKTRARLRTGAGFHNRRLYYYITAK